MLPDPRKIRNSTHHRQAGHPQTVLDNEKLTYAEKEIVQITIQHRPGEIAASRLGKAHININYAYCGLEPGTHAPLAFFGAGDVGGLPG